VREEAADRVLRRRRKRLIRALIVAAVVVFVVIPSALLVGLWISIRQERSSRPPQVEVPNVVGQDFRSGQSSLEARGLKMRVLATRSEQDRPAGTIIDQTPPAGEHIETGHSVGVTVSGKPGQQFGTVPR